MSENKRNINCKYTIEQELEIIEYYLAGNSMVKTGQKFSCNPTTISNILKAYDIHSRNLSEARRNYLNYTINEKAFEKDSPEVAYWLGVMYSDGYISKNKYTNYLGLSVAEKDLEWLISFKEFLGYNGTIKHYRTGETGYKPGSPFVRLQIGNNKIVSDLEHWGVVELKTKKIANIPNTLYKDDFIRGYIDGDGSLLQKAPCFQISGNEEFLLDIAKYFNIPYHLYADKSIYSLKYNRKESIYLEKRLYKNACYYLKRKYDIAQRSFDSPITLEEVMKNSEYQGKSLET